MRLLHTDFNKECNVGLLGYANNKYCLVGRHLSEKLCDEIEKTLKVPVHQISIAGTNLIGAFCVGNNKTLLVPGIIFEDEERMLKKLKINYTVFDTELTALGNNILCNDNGAYVNPDFSAEEKKQIEKLLGVKVESGLIGELEVTGATCVIREDKAVISPYAEKSQIQKIEELLKVTCVEATINFGSPHLKSGLIVNSNGFIAGKLSTGIELDAVFKGLGFE